MADNTKIQWTDATWNPVTGCSPISEGCLNCYAARLAKRLAGLFGYPKDDPFRVTFHLDRLDKPLEWKKPRKIFVCSMGDLFHDDVNEKWIGRVIGHIAAAHWHTFIILTKRPRNALEFCHAIAHYPKGDESKKPIPGLPPNLHFGITAENQKRADERIPILLQIPAAVKFISVEPMLSEIHLGKIPKLTFLDHTDGPGNLKITMPELHWVICGAETGPGARPMDPYWARNLRDQAKAAGVPFFMKAMSYRKHTKAGKEPIPDDLMIREYPTPDKED